VAKVEILDMRSGLAVIVISNGTVVTMDDARTVHFGGHVVIDGDRIASVGPGTYTGEAAGAEVIDASGMIVMPGLIDLHFHTAIGKGYSDHLPLWEYLDECWYPLIRNLDAE
jgi:5-methylthioadenosine/S-adenosylhomocysteine deaminase